MSDLFFQLQDELMPVLHAGDTVHCERRVAEELAKLPLLPFHIAIDLSITISPADVAAYFDAFIRQQADHFKIAAVYTEMNEFDINPDLWFFSAFAFTQYGGHNNYDWLSDWQGEAHDAVIVTGLEPLQSIYAAEKGFKDANYLAHLLVVTKFQDLIRRSVPYMQDLGFPLLATAHDCDFIFEARPESSS
jgi:hypothetical protein